MAGLDDAGVYEAIKSSLTDFEFPPGKQIPVKLIAKRLNVRIKPVRKACRKLAAEHWLIQFHKTDFFAWRPDKNGLAEQYDTIEALLTSAIRHANVENPANDGDRAEIRSIHENLTRRELTDESLAAYTGELFFAIVALTGNEEVKDLIRGSNERLYYLRTLECRFFEDAASELVVLCELTLAGRPDDLKQAIIAYHRRRRDLLPELNEFLAAQ